MLPNMIIGDPPGNHDRILDFSTAVTGSLFFIPTVDFLAVTVAALLVIAACTTTRQPIAFGVGFALWTCC